MKTYKTSEIPETIDGFDVIQNHQIAIALLNEGNTIVRYEFGDSLQPLVSSGQFCKLIPLKDGEEVHVGDIVTSLLDGHLNTHMVDMITKVNNTTYYRIATSTGTFIGWASNIIAKAEPIDHLVKEEGISAVSLKDFTYTVSTDDRWSTDYVGRAVSNAINGIRRG